MSVVQYREDSTSLILNGFAIVDLTEGDSIALAFPNPGTGRVNGENGAVTIVERVDKDVANMTINVTKNSEADRFLSRAKSQGLTVFDGSWKESIIVDNSVSVDSYALAGGSFVEQPTNTKNNQDPNHLMAYVIQFRTAIRT